MKMLAIACLLTLTVACKEGPHRPEALQRWLDTVMDDSVLSTVPPGAEQLGPLTVVDHCFEDIDSSGPEVRRDLQFAAAAESPVDATVDWLTAEGWELKSRSEEVPGAVLTRRHDGFVSSASIYGAVGDTLTVAVAPSEAAVCDS